MTLETVNYQAAKALARHDPGVLPTPAEAVTAAIHAWVSGLDIAMQGADYVVDTPACPDSFWPLPGLGAVQTTRSRPHSMAPLLAR